MKRLFLLRHAKSNWDDAQIADFDRPLNERGLRAARTIGDLIAKRKYDVGMILGSPARRAADTAKIVRDTACSGHDIQLVDRIYEASPQTLISVVTVLDDKFESAIIVGHNPGMEGFLRMLTARSERMPTAALALIDLGINKWTEVVAGSGTLVDLIRPKELP